MTLNEDGRMERVYIPRILYTFFFFFRFSYIIERESSRGSSFSKVVSSSNIIHHLILLTPEPTLMAVCVSSNY